MSRGRYIGDEALFARRNPLLADLDPERRGARNQYPQQICDRRAGDKESGRGLGKGKVFAHPMHNLALYFDWHMIAPAEICINAGSQHLRQHAYRISTSVNPSEESWMGISCRKGQDITHEFAMHRCEVCGFRGRRLAASGTDLVWDRLPNRA